MKAPIVERIAGYSARHRKTAVLGWLGLVALAVVLSGVLGGPAKTSYNPGEDGRAQLMQDQIGGELVRPHENILLQVPAGAGFAPGSDGHEALQKVVDGLNGLSGQVSEVTSPLDPGADALVSPDGRSALVMFALDGADTDKAQQKVILAAIDQVVSGVASSYPGVHLAEAGDASVQKAVDDSVNADFQRAEFTSLPLTLLILMIVFGSLIAAGIPLLLAATSVISALSVMAVVGRWVPIASTASSVVLLIGMAVGVDYTLFYLRREREERAAGRSAQEALDIASRTSGRAIAVSGLTVMVSLAGLWFTGMDAFKGMALGTIVVVGFAVLGSLTVLPGLLAMLRGQVDRAQIPWFGKRRTVANESRFWGGLAQRVVRQPILWGLAAAAVLVLIAAPALSLRISNPSLSDELPKSIPAIGALAEIQTAFPGGPGPARVIITGDVTQSGMDDALRGLHEQAAASGGVLREPITSAVVAGGRAMIVKVPLAGAGTDDAAYDALSRLRTVALPATLGQLPGIEYAVGGETAANYDFNQALGSRTVIVACIVLGFSFLLLVLAFRSVIVSVASIVLNVLSTAAAYGVVTWVFQEGHLGGLLGFTAYGGVISWLPLFMFVILFGLSMDYQVFVLSRIRELRLAGADGADAVVRGIRCSAGVVTSAASIMVAVFAIFATLSDLEYKMLGVGMAVAIALDATIVRGILLPATLSLFIKRAWPLPDTTPAPSPSPSEPASDSPEVLSGQPVELVP